MNQLDLSRSLVIVMAYPDGLVNYSVVKYFVEKGLHIDNIVAAKYQATVIEGRNTVLQRMVIPNLDNYEWFIFLDQDTTPVPGLTDPFLDAVDYDVVGCQYVTNSERSWLKPDNFHMGACRVRSSAIAKLSLPLFHFEYNEEGTKIIGCECEYFKKKLLDKGCTITRRGWIKHESKHTWHS